MDERTSKLIDQLQHDLIDVSDGQITEILRQAREEALAEARVILKDMMVQAILKQALDEVDFADVQEKACPERSRRDVLPVPQAQPLKTATASVQTTVALEALPVSEVLPAASPDISPAQEAAAEHKTQIQQEIEAIRRKIAENEQSLGQLKTSPPAEPQGSIPRCSLPTSTPASLPAEHRDAEAQADEGDAGTDHRGYYVYGIVESKDSLAGDVGIEHRGWPEQGIDPAHPVYALPCRAIQAVVSQVTLKEFGQEALEANLKNPLWLEARVRTHQGVLDTIAAHSTIVPMKFCTIYRSEGRVQEMLGYYYNDFVATLGRLAGRQEWGVKMYMDRDTLALRVEETNERVGALKAELAGKSSGKAYFTKKKLGETLATEVEQLSDERAQKSHDRLAGCAEEARVNPLQSREITSRKEEMLLNGVYLVDKARIEAFRAALESLEQENGNLGLHYELTGPWPPYNFVTIGVAFEDKEIATDE